MSEEKSVHETPNAAREHRFKDGDFILLNMDIFTYSPEGKEHLAITTSKELAEREKIYNPELEYKPEIVCFGRTKLLPKLEEILRDAETGKNYEVILEPNDAYGERKPDAIRTFPLNQILNLPEFREGKETLEVGKTIKIRDENGIQREGKVVTITAGRVRIDFNHPYAGKKMKFNFRVEKVLHTETEKILALIDMIYGKSENFVVEIHGVDTKIKVPERAMLDFNWVTAKVRLIQEIKQRFKTKKVIFIEEYVLRKEENENMEKEKPEEKNTETTENISKENTK